MLPQYLQDYNSYTQTSFFTSTGTKSSSTCAVYPDRPSKACHKNSLLKPLLSSHVAKAAELFARFDLVEAWLVLWLGLLLGRVLLGGCGAGPEVCVSVLLPAAPLLVLELLPLGVQEASLLAHLGHPAFVVIVVRGVLVRAAAALWLVFLLLLLLGLLLW